MEKTAASGQEDESTMARMSLVHVLYAWARRGDLEMARSLLEEAEGAGVQVSDRHVNALLLACVHRDDPDEALRIFNARFGPLEAGAQVMTVAAEEAVGAAEASGGCAQHASGAHRSSRSSHVEARLVASRHSYLFLLRAGLQGGAIDLALRVRQRAEAAGLSLGLDGDTLVMRALVESGEVGSALRLYSERYKGQPSNSLALIRILTAGCHQASLRSTSDHERALWFERALSLFTDGQRMIPPPDISLGQSPLASQQRRGAPSRAPVQPATRQEGAYTTYTTRQGQRAARDSAHKRVRGGGVDMNPYTVRGRSPSRDQQPLQRGPSSAAYRGHKRRPYHP